MRGSHAPHRLESDKASVAHVLWAMDLGGAQRAVYEIVREQRRRGRQADVIVVSQAGVYGEKAREAGARVHELGLRRSLDLRLIRRAGRLLSAYDVIHFHDVDPLLMHCTVRLSGPLLLYTHRAGFFSYPFKRRIRYRLAARQLRRSFHGIFANTKQGARSASAIFAIPIEEIEVVYNGMDFSMLSPIRGRDEVLAELACSDPDLVRIGTSANLRDWKRVHRLLYAAHELSDEAAHYVIIGDGPELPSLQRLSSELGLNGKVSFVGRKEHIGDYLQTLDVFTLPSGPEESFGNSVVEAMGVGLPAVIFEDSGGLGEHVEDGSTGFVARDQTEYVLRLRELVTDKTLRRTLGTAALESVRRKYTPSAMVDRYDERYERADRERGDVNA